MSLAEKLAEYRGLLRAYHLGGLKRIEKTDTALLALLDLLPLYEAALAAYTDFDVNDIDGSDAILQAAKNALALAKEKLP